MLHARAIAFYLPQFHPIPENDEWWGAGFTEWTNTAKARPLYPGHRQPDLPADLGFYDLRLPQARQAQADMARQYGIEAFAYWHYWFGQGRRILEAPFREVLASGEPSLSFCLAWANQTWTGIWHGATNKVLVEQQLSGRRGRPGALRHDPVGVPGRAVPARRRPPGVLRVPARATALRRGVRRSLAGDGPPRRPGRALPRRRGQRPARYGPDVHAGERRRLRRRRLYATTRQGRQVDAGAHALRPQDAAVARDLPLRHRADSPAVVARRRTAPPRRVSQLGQHPRGRDAAG